MKDCFYTPDEVARFMVDAVECVSPGIIADFAAGDGRLLRTARHRWPNAKLVATDIDPQVAWSLRTEPDWSVSCCNFLDTRSRNSARALRGLLGRLSLVLINPPFSNRGGTRIEVQVGRRRTSCGRGIAFALLAAKFLAPGGQMVAVLPAGILSCERDRDALNVLRLLGRSEILTALGRGTFEKCFPRTVIVKLTRHGQNGHSEIKSADADNSSQKESGPRTLVEIVRGTIQMHQLEKLAVQSGTPLIHSTSLKSNSVVINGIRVKANARTISGPAVLLPRVGQPDSRKIAVYTGADVLALSDCVIALKCPDLHSALDLRLKLEQAWTSVESAYGGTGSRFITLNRLRLVLADLGFSASVLSV